MKRYPKIDESKIIYLDEVKAPWNGEIVKRYKVPLQLLHYNQDNGRIATWVSGYQSSSNVTKLEDLSNDEYNEVISGFIKSSSSKDISNRTYNDIKAKGQINLGAILDDGTIVSGNRRFTFLRDLKKETGDIDKYGFFLCTIYEYPNTENERQYIKRIEAQTQFSEDKAVDYSPIDKLVDIYNNVVGNNQLYSESDYGKLLNLKPSDIKNLVTRAKIMHEYLSFIGSPENYDIARAEKLDGEINELALLYKYLRADNDDSEWNSIKGTFYKEIKSTTSGDRTRLLRSLVRAYKSNPDKFHKEIVSSDDDDLLLDDKNKFGIEKTSSEQIQQKAYERKERISSFISNSEIMEARNKPICALNSSYNSLNNVDTDALSLMSDKDKEKAEAVITNIVAKIDLLKKALAKDVS